MHYPSDELKQTVRYEWSFMQTTHPVLIELLEMDGWEVISLTPLPDKYDNKRVVWYAALRRPVG